MITNKLGYFKEYNMKIISFKSKKIALIFLSITMLIITPLVNSTYIVSKDLNDYKIKNLEFTKNFSKPIIDVENNFIKINLEETNSFISLEGHPKLPIYTEVIELPFKSKIIDIKYKISDIEKKIINHKINPVPLYQSINNITPKKIDLNNKIYNSANKYPSEWINYQVGTGINKNDEIVLFLKLHINPIIYSPSQNEIQYINNVFFEIVYFEPVLKKLENNLEYDLVIITQSEFISDLKPLVDHKNQNNILTIIKTIEEIYSEFNGRDFQEKIKYFIKYSIEEWNVKYILLIGDIKKLPIRTTDAYPWSGYHGKGLLSDLYYSDIYDKDFNFCSWDSNNNNIFGEIEEFDLLYDFYINIDDVDLYPDVHIGRIPCTESEELNTVINKIINYEKSTYDQIWFNRIILAGGDTFPLSKGSLPFVYEGEITNIKVGEQLPGFEQIRLWSSKYNLNAHTFNKAIREGAGFLSYAGHGFEHGWGTYKPNSIRNKMGILQPLYYTPFIKYIKNDFRLPIIFFDACLTAKLDFNISDLKDYYGLPVTIFNLLPKNRFAVSDFFPCLSWSFLKDEKGGSIASIGSTRPAYTYVDKYGVYAGAGYLDVHFFKAYNEGTTIGQMLTQSQLDYINYVGKDFFTIEEFILIGDPSLKVGGYP
jgi:hypothetical protein